MASDDDEAATMVIDERVLLSVPAVVVPTTASASRTLVHVEVCLRALCTVDAESVTTKVSAFLRQHRAILLSEQLTFDADKELRTIVRHARVHVPDTCVDTVFYDDAELDVHVYQLNEDGAAEELADSEEDIAACQTYTLPASEFEGVWESLVYEDDTKRRLLNYARTAMLFSDHNVDANLIAWNRIILLFGPPGTGKTSLCKGIAQKLSIRLSRRYQHAQFVEINAHSLFSKWFSESGKLVLKLFQRINDLVDDDSSLVFVLIDEVESLAAARHAALSGSEPSDSIRAVNALLTQLDQLKSKPNVIVFTTSNISKAIDLAFVDRADMKMYIGPPVLQARIRILRTCMDELVRVGILPRPEGENITGAEHDDDAAEDDVDDELGSVAALAEGLSGRALRRLPFQAHAMFLGEREPSSVPNFYAAMRRAIQYELETQQKTSLQHSN